MKVIYTRYIDDSHLFLAAVQIATGQVCWCPSFGLPGSYSDQELCLKNNLLELLMPGERILGDSHYRFSTHFIQTEQLIIKHFKLQEILSELYLHLIFCSKKMHFIPRILLEKGN